MSASPQGTKALPLLAPLPNYLLGCTGILATISVWQFSLQQPRIMYIIIQEIVLPHRSKALAPAICSYVVRDYIMGRGFHDIPTLC
jgi:hypothetical protein